MFIDNAQWKVLQKMADSNNPAQRSEAYKVGCASRSSVLNVTAAQLMIAATVRMKSVPQLVKTLTFLIKKIKNEAGSLSAIASLASCSLPNSTLPTRTHTLRETRVCKTIVASGRIRTSNYRNYAGRLH